MEQYSKFVATLAQEPRDCSDKNASTYLHVLVTSAGGLGDVTFGARFIRGVLDKELDHGRSDKFKWLVGFTAHCGPSVSQYDVFLRELQNLLLAKQRKGLEGKDITLLTYRFHDHTVTDPRLLACNTEEQGLPMCCSTELMVQRFVEYSYVNHVVVQVPLIAFCEMYEYHGFIAAVGSLSEEPPNEENYNTCLLSIREYGQSWYSYLAMNNLLTSRNDAQECVSSGQRMDLSSGIGEAELGIFEPHLCRPTIPTDRYSFCLQLPKHPVFVSYISAATDMKIVGCGALLWVHLHNMRLCYEDPTVVNEVTIFTNISSPGAFSRFSSGCRMMASLLQSRKSSNFPEVNKLYTEPAADHSPTPYGVSVKYKCYCSGDCVRIVFNISDFSQRGLDSNDFVQLLTKSKFSVTTGDQSLTETIFSITNDGVHSRWFLYAAPPHKIHVMENLMRICEGTTYGDIVRTVFKLCSSTSLSDMRKVMETLQLQCGRKQASELLSGDDLMCTISGSFREYCCHIQENSARLTTSSWWVINKLRSFLNSSQSA